MQTAQARACQPSCSPCSACLSSFFVACLQFHPFTVPRTIARMQRLVSMPATFTCASPGERRLAPYAPVALRQKVHGVKQRLRKHTHVHAQEPSGAASCKPLPEP